MSEEQYYEYKDELKNKKDKLELKLEELNADYDAEDDESRCHELELKISYTENDLEEVEDELRRLCDTYYEYACEMKEYFNQERGEI